MSRAIRHHIVPRFFLRRFADDQRMLLVRNLKEGREFEASPKRVAYELDYYTVDTAAGPSDAIEQALSKGESLAAQALREIDAGAFPPSEQARGAISSFMAMQFVRGQDFRDMGDRAATGAMRMMGQVAASQPDYVRRVLPKALGREVTDDEVQGVIAGLEKADVTVKVAREQHIETMLHVANEAFPFFVKRKWFLVEGKDFPTTDMPVVLWQRPRGGFFGQGVGVMTADEIAMAIGPTRALVLVHPDEITGGNSGAERRVTFSKETEEQLRLRIWQNALRYQFRHPSSPAPNGAR